MIKTTRLSGWAGLAGLLLAALALAGCTGTPSASSSESIIQQRADAAAFLDCLAQANVPALLYDDDRFGATVVWEATEWVANRDQSGRESVTYQPEATRLSAEEEAFFLGAAEGMTDGPLLIIDGQDYSQAYSRCLGQTSYVHPSSSTSLSQPTVTSSAGGSPPAYDPAKTVLEQTNRWAACARANGWPDISDASYPVPAGQLPLVEIPATITAEQLQQLMVVCPGYDAAAYALAEQAWASGQMDYPTPPSPNLAIAELESDADPVAYEQLLDLLNQLLSQAYLDVTNQ
jgi:hypothetical protein